MTKLTNTLVNEVVESCLNKYNELPKTGKPVADEWTVLSCVVQYDTSNNRLDVVSLGTGSKCIGHTKMSPNGDILNDSHAEVFARRGFMLYLYDNIEKCNESNPSIFTEENKQFRLKNNVEFIFYSSQVPCGDASIILKTEDIIDTDTECYGDLLKSSKHRAPDDIFDDNECKKRKMEMYAHSTGAKCLSDSEQDLIDPGGNYHLLGQVRTKPGRGDRTLSVSCSDKIARWIHVGIQGALLSLLLCEPVYVKHFVFGADVLLSMESLNRALLNRGQELQPPFVPEMYYSKVTFPFRKTEKNIRPAPGSIVWCETNSQPLEVAVRGRRLGVTKKNSNSCKNSLCISKYNLYRKFKEIVEVKCLKQNIVGSQSLSDIPYNVMKKKSQKYLCHWADVKNIFFKTWTVKPDMWDFCIDNS